MSRTVAWINTAGRAEPVDLATLIHIKPQGPYRQALAEARTIAALALAAADTGQEQAA